MRKFNVTVNGIPFEVSIEETNEFSAKAAPAPVAAPIVTTPAATKEAEAPAPIAVPAGGVQLKAPMPGTVLKFSVASGSQIKKGQKVCVLEAMKMENDIVSPSDGTISFVITEGSNVSSGTVIAVIS